MTTVTRTDFRQVRTVATLADFARRFPAWPYVWFRGRLFAPLFLGASERPAFRVSRSLSDRGEIALTWPDGRRFETQGERDRAALAEAARLAPDDSTAAEAAAFLARRGRGRRRESPAAAQRYQDIPGALSGETQGSRAVLASESGRQHSAPLPGAGESTPQAPSSLRPASRGVRSRGAGQEG